MPKTKMTHKIGKDCPNNPGETWDVNHREDGTCQCDLCGTAVLDCEKHPETKTTHTSGPLHRHYGVDGKIYVLDRLNRQIARIESKGTTADFDADLFAAAPDQHAILCKIAERLDRWQQFGISAGPKGKDADFEDLKAEARAAINKAEG